MTKHTTATLLVFSMACVLAACSGAEAPADAGHAATPGAEHTSSSAGLPKGDVVAGKALASVRGPTGQSCADCHGAEGNNPIDDAYPKLGGQYRDYLEHALQAYRSGDRSGSVTSDLMANQAKALNDQQIADLAAYYASVSGQLRDLRGAN